MPNVIENCVINLFADDTLIFCHGKNMEEIIRKIESDLRNIEKWLSKNKLKLNVEKTKCMFIKGNRNRDDTAIQIHINGELIARTSQMKYLGVLIDDRLNFKENNSYICKKVAKKIGFFARVARNLTTSAKINLYKSIIATHFDYCSSLLFLADCEDKNTFQKLQNRAMRVILGCSRYTSVARMLEALQWQSVRQRIISRTLQFIFKVKNDSLPVYLKEFVHYNAEVHTYPSRRRNDFRLPNVKKSSTQNNIFFRGLQMYNDMPNEIKNESNINIFKRKVNNYIKSIC